MRWLPCLSNFLRANGAFTSAVALACCAWPLASAQPGPVAPIDFTFDAGFACPGFPLRVQTFGGRLLTFNRATGGTVTVIQSGTFVVYTNGSASIDTGSSGAPFFTRRSVLPWPFVTVTRSWMERTPSVSPG